MKKLTLIPLALIVLVGALWASSIITPDKPGFPSNPQTPGTLGYILSLFGTDGRARDSLALGGVSATGYLQASNTTCTNPGEVWKGINTDGTVECGTRGTLLAIGRFSEISGAVEVSTNGTSWTTANTTDTLSEGTIVRTTSGTGTIAFVADDSVLRLDTDTVVQLQSGDLGGNTVAQAILADGRLWGRVLTSTGVNIGGGGLIAGVRGTSISIAKSGNDLTLDIIDSVSLTAATIINKNSTSGTTTTAISSEQSITFSSGSESIPPAVTKSKATLLTDTWIRQNTLSDIAYLTDKLDTNTRAIDELDATLPSDMSTLSNLTNTTIAGTDSDDQDIISDTVSNVDRKEAIKRKGKKTLCKKEGKRYWSSLDRDNKTPSDYCKEKDLVAFADYTSGDDQLYFRNDTVSLSSSSTYDISGKTLGTYTVSIEGALAGTNLEIFTNTTALNNDEDNIGALTSSNTSKQTTGTLLKKNTSFSKLIIKK